ncbi:MAG: hypothetical protein GEV11_13480 [Streptosporangiales bacterium]|nr:hypothetical protein [Streptosporangiales bacterium]
MEIVAETPYRFRIERTDGMRVPGVVFASDELLPGAHGDRSPEQVAGVATLPGIVTASYAMPDVHWGYGFPIGGVAATDIEDGGVVSPGGVGFDICCGVRLLVARDDGRERLAGRLTRIMDELGRLTPRGTGCGGLWRLTGRDELEEVLRGGAAYAVERGHGVRRDLDVDGRRRRLCVHRKGATRALPPGHPGLPGDLTSSGEPVLVPGTMGTASHVLAGTADGVAFHSTAHGAGRMHSRHQAARNVDGERLAGDLRDRGIQVRAASWRGLAEEAPQAYKDVDEVVRVTERNGLARRVARLVPLGVVKG